MNTHATFDPLKFKTTTRAQAARFLMWLLALESNRYRQQNGQALKGMFWQRMYPRPFLSTRKSPRERLA